MDYETLSEKISLIQEKICNDDSDLLRAMYRYASQKYSLVCPQKVVKSSDCVSEGKIFLNVDNISFIEIWNTNMRNKVNAILDAISEVEIERLDKKTLHEIMMEKANEKNSKINDSDKIKLDDIIKEFLAMEQVRANDVLYVCDELSNDKIFFINEFEKFLKALDLGDGRNKYIYDMVCEELENNFLKFNFCNFKNDKCTSQRHKNFFANNYPYSSTDGCCFKIINKCQHNNKDGTCKVKCISCKLFICPYLSARGIRILCIRTFAPKSIFYTKAKKNTCK